MIWSFQHVHHELYRNGLKGTVMRDCWSDGWRTAEKRKGKKVRGDERDVLKRDEIMFQGVLQEDLEWNL